MFRARALAIVIALNALTYAHGDAVQYTFLTDAHCVRWALLENALLNVGSFVQPPSRVVVVALDDAAFDRCRLKAAHTGVTSCARASDFLPYLMESGDGGWGHARWNGVVNRFKPAIISHMLLHNADGPRRVCFVDADLALRADPAHFLERWPLVITAENGGLNSGFICVDTRNERAVDTLQKYARVCRASNFTAWEQRVLSDLASTFSADDAFFHAAAWRDGFDHACRGDADRRPTPTDVNYDRNHMRYAMHAACANDPAAKIDLLNRTGCWLLPPDAHPCAI